MSVTYILGAGFSKAINDNMPTMPQLSQHVVEKIPIDRLRQISGASLFRHDFEAWLTYLSTEQPWLKQSENLRNQAAFFEIAEAVSEVIEKIQNLVFKARIPPWLTTLAHHWDQDSASVITFNYDSLVEAAAQEVLPGAGGMKHGASVYPVALTPLSSRVPSQGLSSGTQRRLAFRLLKLHGSVNWFYSGHDAPHGDTVYLREGTQTWKPQRILAHSREEAEEGVLLDKSPLIVPPTAMKTMFYGNDILRAQWRLAAQAISEVDELHIIGYSAPEGDLLVRALISTNFKGRRIVVVNPQEGVGDHLRSFLPAETHVSVEQMVDLAEYARELPPLYVRCVSDNHEYRRVQYTLLELSELRPGQLRDQSCPLCPTADLTSHPQSQGEFTGFRCPCCMSMWVGEDSLYFVRCERTEVSRETTDAELGIVGG